METVVGLFLIVPVIHINNMFKKTKTKDTRKKVIVETLEQSRLIVTDTDIKR